MSTLRIKDANRPLYAAGQLQGLNAVLFNDPELGVQSSTI